MRKLLLLIVCITISFVGRSQQEYYVSKSSFYLSSEPSLTVSGKSSNGATFCNANAASKHERQSNTISEHSATFTISESKESVSKAISFSIHNINIVNKNGSYYRYSVYDENGKQTWCKDIYWGITISFEKTYGTSGEISFWHNEKCPTGDGGYMFGHDYSCSSCTIDSFGYNSGWNREYSRIEHLNMKIYLDSNGNCKIVPSTMFRAREFSAVSRITSISVRVGSGAKIMLSNLKVEKQSLYGQVKKYIDDGDNKAKNKSYMDAAVAYSKAIECGYKNYDIYYRRAWVYALVEFYNNAIDDCTMALSYKQTQEAYLLRGRLKLLKSDLTCLDDLKKGGVEGESIAREIEMEIAKQPSSPRVGSSEYSSSGSGIFLSTNGIIITNYHVIENAQKIDVFIKRNNDVRKYNAKVLISDKQNDLTLLKIQDATFTYLPALPYAVKSTILDVGTSVFALGYPMSDTLGEELKVTDGIISSKTGYQGDIVTYQISAPIQPGNSGGPLFDKQGYLVGITNAGVPDAQNVGYAIKISYLRNLVDVSPVPFVLPSNNAISGLSFTEKIKKISPYVVLIKVK